MKKLFLFLLVVLLYSCKSEQEQRIADYLQKGKDTKTDLNFRAIKTHELREYTEADAAKIKAAKLSVEIRRSIRKIWNEIDFADSTEIAELQARLKSLETDCKGTEYEEQYNLIQKNMNSQKAIGYLYVSEYSITPSGSNEITHVDTFVFNLGKDSVRFKYFDLSALRTSEDKMYDAEKKFRSENGLRIEQ